MIRAENLATGRQSQPSAEACMSAREAQPTTSSSARKPAGRHRREQGQASAAGTPHASGGQAQRPSAEVPFEYVFPALRGVQARREYFVSMCPLRLIPRIFLFNEEELVPELRAQRVLNKGRIPEMVRYIVGNRES